jgi:RimJ/RimL family protein N-acetyltransferase
MRPEPESMSSTCAANDNAVFKSSIDDSNTALEIRQAFRSDYLALSALLHHLDRETPYLDFMPGERSPQTFELQRSIIADPSGKAGVIFLASLDGNAIGFLQAQICPLQRLRHTVTIEIGVRKHCIGRGVGTRLFAAVEQWARERKAHRLELTVATHNERALALYRKCGFTIEGERRHALLLYGIYMDEYLMGKLLS